MDVGLGPFLAVEAREHPSGRVLFRAVIGVTPLPGKKMIPALIGNRFCGCCQLQVKVEVSVERRPDDSVDQLLSLPPSGNRVQRNPGEKNGWASSGIGPPSGSLERQRSKIGKRRSQTGFVWSASDLSAG